MSVTFLDLIALAVLVLAFLLGRRAGLIKTAVSLVSLLVAAVAAFVLASPTAAFLYDRFWPDTAPQEAVTETVTEEEENEPVRIPESEKKAANGLIEALAQAADSDRTVSEIVEEYNAAHGTDFDLSALSLIGVAPDQPVPPLLSRISENLDTLWEDAENLLNRKGDSVKDYADALTASISRYLVLTALTVAAFVVILVLVRLLLWLVAVLLTKCIEKIPVIGGANRLLGGILGAVIGLAVVLIAFVILHQAAIMSTDAAFAQLVSSSLGDRAAALLGRLFLTSEAV